MNIQVLALDEKPMAGRAVVRLSSGECIRISIINQDWCFIKQSKFGWLGKTLYAENGNNPAVVALLLAKRFQSIDVPAYINPMLIAFMKGVYACSTATEVEMLFRLVHERAVLEGKDADITDLNFAR